MYTVYILPGGFFDVPNLCHLLRPFAIANLCPRDPSASLWNCDIPGKGLRFRNKMRRV